MPRLSEAMKDVISCEKFGLGANNPWYRNLRMGQPTQLKTEYHLKLDEAYVMNWNILVVTGKENKRDSLSSGERTGSSPNLSRFGAIGVVGLRYDIIY